jgi:acyl dehydratase
MRTDLSLGDSHRSERIVGNNYAISRFARSIRDTNPIHHDTAVARDAGLRDIIAPGVMVMGFVSATLTEWIPGAMIMRTGMKFVRPLYADTHVTVSCLIARKRGRIVEVSVGVKDVEGTVAQGLCTLLL